MPEFRQNFASKEWVIIATERGKRPHDFKKDTPPSEPLPEYDPDCPFCAGNEERAPEHTLIIERDGKWKVRIVPNKYAALDSNADRNMHRRGRYLQADGFGIAEVVVETPQHNLTVATMTNENAEDIVRAYRTRYNEIAGNTKVNLITVFRNHGPMAGTSLEHPHSQIIATPIVPPHVRDPITQLKRAYDTFGTCLYCDMIADEIERKERIVEESEYFVALCPFASRSPFETTIYPKIHNASFGNIGEAEIADLAGMLKRTLSRIYIGLKNPDYNYIIRSAPVEESFSRSSHWYIIIIPKLTTPAGFELGSGIYINVTLPENCAEFLKGVDISRQ